ncbi:MAG: AAA family ATPase [Nitrospirae bacterium]|nr:AAA family ATPase [Nitrospirota bacterium]
MFKIDKIKISGFRRLREIEIKMTDRPFIVLIGANGVGKTSLLDAFSLLAASASGHLNATLSQFGGFASILTRDKSEELSFLVDMSVDTTVQHHKPLTYELHLSPKGTGYSLSREVLSQDRDGHSDPVKYIDSSYENICYYDIDKEGFVHPTWTYNPFETSLSQVPKTFSESEEFRSILAATTIYHVLDVGLRAPVKLPQQMRPATLPGVDGEDLVPYLYYLRESDRDRFDTIVAAVNSAFPDFEELNFPPVAAGTLAMTWRDRKFAKPMYMHELSEGMLRFLWLVSLLQSPTLPTITMIDEPEVSLHPELLSLLADLMRETSLRTQLIVATHSDRLIRFLKPEEVVVMDIAEDWCATVVWADSLDLEKWLDEYSLDEVWQMGRMGGR